MRKKIEKIVVNNFTDINDGVYLIIKKINEFIDHLNIQPQAGVFTEFTDKNISDDIPKGFVDIDGKLHKFEYNPEKKGEWEEKQRSLVEKAQIEVLTEIFQTCYQEDSKTLELVEEKLSKLTTK